MARYSSGDWYGIVTPAGMALLPGGVTVETLERVWTAMHAGKGLGAVIEGLVGAFGTSLSRLPDFAVLALGPDGVKVAVRGAVEATLQVSVSPEPLSISGAGVTTWNERAATDVISATLAVPGGSAEFPLPLADGIVCAESLHWVLIETESEPLPAPPAPMPTAAVEPAAPPPPPADELPPAPPPHPADEVEAAQTPPSPEPPPAPPRGGGETTLIEKITAVSPSPYDQLLFGETVLSSVEDAAVREAESDGTTVGPAAAPPPPPPPPPAPPGDHDGETVLVDQLRLLQAAAAAAAPAQPAPQRRPPLLRVSGASPVVLDRSAIIGTRPRLARVQPGNVPHLIPVNSPSSEISRSHLELRVEGHSVLAVDLDSTNGTLLLRSGAEPVRLQPHEPNLLVPGDRIDLGDGVVLEFEGLQ